MRDRAGLKIMAGDPIDDIDVEHAARVADGAIQSRAKQWIPATPNNFSVWFNYAMGATPALRKTIDILVSGKRKFDASVNHDLFVTYISPQASSAPPVHYPEQLQGVITNAKQFLATAIADNRTQIEALGEVSSECQTSSDPRPIIGKLVSELAKATHWACVLETEFLTTSKELDSIRKSLREAEERSNTDALTGLANRRSMDEFLRSAQIVAMEKGEPLSVLLIDIDHFKKINDSHGHATGDRVLIELTRLIRENMRGADIFARWGGEEFIAILPDIEPAEVSAIAERVRDVVAATPFHVDDAELSISISIGVATAPRPGANGTV